MSPNSDFGSHQGAFDLVEIGGLIGEPIPLRLRLKFRIWLDDIHIKAATGAALRSAGRHTNRAAGPSLPLFHRRASYRSVYTTNRPDRSESHECSHSMFLDLAPRVRVDCVRHAL